MSNGKGFVFIIIGIIAIVGVISSVILLYNSSQPLIEAGKQQDVDEWADNFTIFLYVVILVLFITIIGTIIFSIIQGR
jgi:hypothetical protein